MNTTQKNRSKRGLKHPRLQRGDFLVSLTIALIIVAIIGGSAFVYLKENTRKNEINESVTKVGATAGALRKSFGINNQYGSVTTAVAVKARVIPEDQRIPTTDTAQNIYGGLVTVAPVTLTQANDAVALTWNNVPVAQCSDIVLGTAGVARSISVAGTTVKAVDGTVNIATLTTQCDVAAPVAIIWNVGRTGS